MNWKIVPGAVFLAVLLGLGRAATFLCRALPSEVRRSLNVSSYPHITTTDGRENSDNNGRQIERGADLCSSVAGAWYNQLGSKMVLQHEGYGLLRGLYWTAVERSSGAAGVGPQDVIGYSPESGSNKVFGYSVLWRGGESVTSWTAQCIVCENQPVLMTSWILRPKQGNCLDEWKASMTGEDFYTRHEQRPLTRAGIKVTDPPVPNIKSVACKQTSDVHGVCDLNGLWEDEYGNRMEIKHCDDGALKGERWHAFPGGATSNFTGWANIAVRNTTLSMIAVDERGQVVTGWTGQCHVCQDKGEEQIKTSWFQRHLIPYCSNNMRSTKYGHSIFVRVHPESKNDTVRPNWKPPPSVDDFSPCSETSASHGMKQKWSFLIFFCIGNEGLGVVNDS